MRFAASLRRQILAVVLAYLIAVPTRADEARNAWDFSTNEGRASFFAAILNEDPDLVSRNLSFRRDPWEILPQIEAVLKVLPKQHRMYGARHGTVIESVPSSVQVVYSEKALNELRETLKKDIETLGDLKDLKPLTEEMAARKGDIRTWRSLLRLVPFLYDASGKLIGDAASRETAKLNERVATVERADIDNLYRDLFSKHQLPIIKEALDKTETETLRSRMKSAVQSVDLADLKSLNEELKARAGKPKERKELLRLAPVLYDKDGEPLDTPEERAAKVAERIEAANLAEWQTRLAAQTHTMVNVPTEDVRDAGAGTQAIQSTLNYISREVTPAVTAKKIYPDETAKVNGTRTSIQLQEVPPEIGVFRGCYGGDCSAFSVPHYSFAEGARTFFVRKTDSDTFGEQPVGYVLMLEEVIDGKKVPYIVTINGRLSTPMASEIIRMIAAEYKTDKVLLPRMSHSTNKYLVNTDDIRNAYGSTKEVKSVTLEMSKSWQTIDKLIGEKSGAYDNYYLTSNVKEAMLVEVPNYKSGEGVLIQKDQPLPYQHRDIKQMPPFERALLASRVAEKDKKLQEHFGVDDAQMKLAKRLSNIALHQPLSAAEIADAEKTFGLSWKDWSKLPKDILLASLLNLTPDERAKLKGYPGDAYIDKITREIVKQLDPQKIDKYTAHLGLALRVPNHLRSPQLAAKLDEEYSRLKNEFQAEVNRPSPDAKQLLALLRLIEKKTHDAREAADIRAILNRSFFLVPDSTEFTSFLHHVAYYHLDASPVDEADAAARKHLLSEISVRGSRSAQIAAARIYFQDPASHEQEGFLLTLFKRGEALNALLASLKSVSDTTGRSTMRGILDTADKDPFLTDLIPFVAPSTEEKELREILKNVQEKVKAEEMAMHAAIVQHVGHEHFWKMKSIPSLVLPSASNSYYYASLDAFLDKALRLAPPDFLKTLVERTVQDETAAKKVAAKINELIEVGDWENPLLKRADLLTIVLNSKKSTIGDDFAKAVLGSITRMPDENARICIGATCGNPQASDAVAKHLFAALAAGNMSHFLIKDRNTVEILLSGKNGSRPKVIQIVFSHPAATLRYLDQLFALGREKNPQLKTEIQTKTHYNYPPFAPIKEAVVNDKPELLTDEAFTNCVEGLKQMGLPVE